jgi:integrase
MPTRDEPMSTPRRGWRETIEQGTYRTHRVACPSSADQRPGRRCGCPLQILVPGAAPGSSRMLTFDGSLTQARAERRRLMAQGRPRVETLPEAGTLHEFTLAYFKAKEPTLAPSTVKARSEAYRSRIAPTLGALELADVTRERVEVWLAGIIETESPHAVWKAVGALRAILKVAVEWGRIPTNPAARLRLPRHNGHGAEPATRVLDERQLDALFAQAADKPGIQSMMMVAGESGLRRGELVGLRWPDVDLEARRLTVARSVWRTSARNGVPTQHLIRPPKGGKPRVVPLSERAVQALTRWRERSVPAQVATLSYVWPGRTGGPIDATYPGRALRKMERAAGLVDAEGNPLVTLHGLRHTAGSIMLGAGVSLIAVQHVLGHANPQITARVYSHLVDRDRQLDEAMAVFDRPREQEATKRATAKLKAVKDAVPGGVRK